MTVAPSLEDEAGILRSEGVGSVASELAAIARSPSKRTTLRLAALAKLDEAKSPVSVVIAEELTASADPELRTNAVSVLVRSDRPGAKEALARVKAASLDLAVLATRLERRDR